ncbi:hypothetical protein [Mesorhizobium sp. M1A.T.Ca.IN.004.03.1.1]|nr:hypothetical protein [Mesorhizobium sp. M1A.T.Ca.IN.004.03.1.1]
MRTGAYDGGGVVEFEESWHAASSGDEDPLKLWQTASPRSLPLLS